MDVFVCLQGVSPTWRMNDSEKNLVAEFLASHTHRHNTHTHIYRHTHKLALTRVNIHTHTHTYRHNHKHRHVHRHRYRHTNRQRDRKGEADLPSGAIILPSISPVKSHDNECCSKTNMSNDTNCNTLEQTERQ